MEVRFNFWLIVEYGKNKNIMIEGYVVYLGSFNEVVW